MQLSLDRLFVEQARRTPDHVALRDGEGAMTYAELDTRSARAAAALSACGIGSGAVVGLHIERSIDWVTATLAILRANAAVMPLPPNYPPARLREILAHARLRAVIHNQTTPIDPVLARLSLDLDELCSETPSPLPASDMEGDSDVDRPAFVLCSSGSTGLPKMIVRSHHSFHHRLAWTWEQHPFVAGEVGCHKAHTTTTHGIYELFEPLLRGVQTVIIADPQVRDLEQFWTLVRSHGITRLLIVPSAIQASLDLPGFEPPSLKVVVLMGEHLSSSLAQRIVDAFPRYTALYSIYGSTEASSTIACNLRESVGPGKELPLGQPIAPEVGVHVLDSRLEPVAPGQTGRLYFSGPALFAGYFGQPELTSQVVVRHPRRGERLYDSRDDVRRMPDGNIVYVGRVDDTVKIRGFRVELAEVERAMNACPDVTQAAVVVTGSGSDAALIGFFTPRDVPVREVFGVLHDRLPPYMIPASLVGLDAFPLTERSKLDRKRLLAEYRAVERQQSHEQVLSGVEQRVATVWERTLGHRRFDLDSSFFEVGGTSLTTAVLVHCLRVEFGLDRERLPEQFVYRFPTVASMARHLGGSCGQDAAEASGQSSILVTLRRASDRSKPPLFCVASAGGTLGAYHKVAAALRYKGEIIGIRDPYVSGERDPTESFDRWVGHYFDAIWSRHPDGPYCIAAYSSAGAFGYELARRLRQARANVALLALIDPLGMEGDRWQHFGWWVWRSTYSRPWVRAATRFAGGLRRPLAVLLRKLGRRRTAESFALSAEEFRQLGCETALARGHLMALAALMELNTGLPLDLSDADIPPEPPNSTLQALQARVAAVMPGGDAETIERIATQYTLQARAQRAYALAPYDGPALLIEPVTPYAGLIEAQLRPYLSHLRVVRLELGATDERARVITRRFGTLAPHFLSMRDDRFALSLARELDSILDGFAA